MPIQAAAAGGGDMCWDIGAGTGSVAIEMALQAWRGQVYAVECREDALELLQKIRCRFGAENPEDSARDRTGGL